MKKREVTSGGVADGIRRPARRRPPTAGVAMWFQSGVPGKPSRHLAARYCAGALSCSFVPRRSYTRCRQAMVPDCAVP